MQVPVTGEVVQGDMLADLDVSERPELRPFSSQILDVRIGITAVIDVVGLAVGFWSPSEKAILAYGNAVF